MTATPRRDENIVSPTRSLSASILIGIEQYWPIILPVLLIIRVLYKRYASPLRKYPGPWLASCSRLWKFISTARGRTNYEFIDLHRNYGPIVRIAPNEVSIASPTAARNVLAAGKRFYKTDFYAVFPPPQNPDIFTEIREEVHAQKKKVANVPYSMAAMRQLSPFIDDTIELLASKVGEFCPSGGDDHGRGFDQRSGRQILDLGAWLHFFAFDVLGEVAFGRAFGFLEAGIDVEGAIKTIDDSQRYNGLVGQVPELDLLLRKNPLWKLVPFIDPGHTLVTKIAMDEMSKRKPFATDKEGKGGNSDGREDLLASLIKGHLKNPSKFTEGDVFAVSHGAIFAGSDSTASTMQSFFWHVLRAPRVYAKLLLEIDVAVKSGAIPSSGNVEWTQSQDLLYFQACLKEAMRMRPAVGLCITRHVPPEGADIEGEHLPGGTRVAVNGWVIHRDAATFGEDADFYRPERWTEDEENAKVMERYMVQFGGGAHVCIGRNLALLEINKVLPRLLRDYRFELVDPNSEIKAKSTFFVVQEGLEVFATKRNEST